MFFLKEITSTELWGDTYTKIVMYRP